MTECTTDNHSMSFGAIKEQCQSVFSLKRSNSSATAPFILVDFSLPQSLKEDPFFTSMNLIPTFNRDGKFYTPSFILGSELNKYISNDEGYRMVHDKKIAEMNQERQQIFVPKPSKANSYCCICRQGFEDYLTHVNVPKHKQLMKKSSYYKMIEELCGEYNQGTGKGLNSHNQNEKTENKMIVAKKKKIIKITTLSSTNSIKTAISTSSSNISTCVIDIKQKRGRGRPRRVQSSKMQMLVSIPTNVSILV